MQANGLIGRLLTKLGNAKPEKVSDRVSDVLRRTNRGIFFDSIPTTLYAAFVHQQHLSGDLAMADMLVDGPLPPLMDDESRGQVHRVASAFRIEDGEKRYRELCNITHEQFDREQAIFTWHLGAHRTQPPDSPPHPMNQPKSVLAPQIQASQLTFKPHKLPSDFDMRDHGKRVRHFGEAFVSSVTSSPHNYQVAVEWVVNRYGNGDPLPKLVWAMGGTPRPDLNLNRLGRM
jgi:hypothetical protein